jgi:hypothetical protein
MYWGILVILLTSFFYVKNKGEYRVKMEQEVGDVKKEYTI